MRGIRYFLHNHDLEQNSYYSKEYWQQYFFLLAQSRFNRFNLVFAHQTNYLAPPCPFWLALPEFPGIRVPGLSDASGRRTWRCFLWGRLSFNPDFSSVRGQDMPARVPARHAESVRHGCVRTDC